MVGSKWNDPNTMSKVELDQNATITDIETADRDFASALGAMAVSPRLAKDIIKFNTLAGIPTLLIGRSGVGKTDIMYQLTAELSEGGGRGAQYTHDLAARRKIQISDAQTRWGLNVFHLQHLEREDLSGYVFPPKTADAEPQIIMRPGLPNGKDHPFGFLYLDEFNRADKEVISPVFTLLSQGRNIGPYVLPAGWTVVLAGNPSDDDYLVNEAEKDPAIRRRVCIIVVVCNVRDWLSYAVATDFDPFVVDYIRAFGGRALYDLTGQRQGRISATPATWERVSTIVKLAKSIGVNFTDKQKVVPADIQAAIAGQLGYDLGIEFLRYLSHKEDYIDAGDVLRTFTPGSAVYLRVQKLAEVTGQLNDLAARMAEHIAIELPSPLTVTKQVAEFALFLGEHHADALQAFKEQLYTKLSTNSGGPDYRDQFNSSLTTQPAWRTMCALLQKKNREIGEKVEKHATQKLPQSP